MLFITNQHTLPLRRRLHWATDAWPKCICLKAWDFLDYAADKQVLPFYPSRERMQSYAERDSVIQQFRTFVGPSVCHTRWCCDKTAKHIMEILLPTDDYII